jgi:hypothetical protein
MNLDALACFEQQPQSSPSQQESVEGQCYPAAKVRQAGVVHEFCFFLKKKIIYYYF